MDRDFDCGFAGFSDNVIRKPQDFATEAKSTVKKSGNVLNSKIKTELKILSN